MAETILDVFLSTGFTGDVCTWFIEENPNYDLPMLFVEFRVRDKLHVICGLVPEALALEGIQELNAKYKMIRIDNSTVQ